MHSRNQSRASAREIPIGKCRSKRLSDSRASFIDKKEKKEGKRKKIHDNSRLTIAGSRRTRVSGDKRQHILEHLLPSVFLLRLVSLGFLSSGETTRRFAASFTTSATKWRKGAVRRVVCHR
jgi:hypothetical protein